jgi:serine/threonine protein kinase
VLTYRKRLREASTGDYLVRRSTTGDVQAVPAIAGGASLILTGQLPGYRVTAEPVLTNVCAIAQAVRESDGADVTVHVVVEPLDRATLRRFRTEVSSMATALEELKNPWIVPLVDHGQTVDARPFFVTDAPGASLADELAERGPLPVTEVRRTVATAVPALVSLHKAGLLHRGLGPAALIRQPSGRVLLDAPLMPVLAEISVAETMGTGHEPIEVLSGGDWTTQAEVYAFASTVWALLTGRPPVAGSWDERLLIMLDDGSPLPSAPELPQRVVEVLRQALERKPEDRLSSLTSLALRVREELADPDGALAAPPPKPSISSERAMGTDYELLSELGSGSTGKVWRALRKSDRREVAVKELNPEADVDGTGLTRLVREHATLRGLDHPHLVKVLDIVVDRGRAAIVMEFVPGADLRELLRTRQVERADGIRLLSEVASGLAHLHEFRIVHRDIKPANILIRTTGDRRHALLTDFGLAKPLGAPDLTRVGLLLGTPSYLAPELIASGEPTPEADVYALGVTAYEVLAGRRPFTGVTTDEVLRQHQTRRPARPAGLPDSAWRFLLACLDKDPRARPGAAEAADVLHDLGREITLAPADPKLESTPEHTGFDGTSESVWTYTSGPRAEPAFSHVEPTEESVPTRTSARRPESSPPPADRAPAHRRRFLVLIVVVAAIVAMGYAIGSWTAKIVGSDTLSSPSPPSPGSPSGVHRVPVTAVVGTDGAVVVSWPAATTSLPGLDRFVVMQGNNLRAEVPPSITVYRDSEPREIGCYYVIALGTTAPPTNPAPESACPTR